MGCDIHAYVERKHPTLGWVLVDPPQKGGQPKRGDPDYYDKIDWTDWGRWMDEESDLKRLGDTKKDFLDIIPEVCNAWAFGRNYTAFGELAGVRSGGVPFIPRRGVPEDICDLLFLECWEQAEEGSSKRGMSESWRRPTNRMTRDGKEYVWIGDWHSPHWYSLGEMKTHAKGRNVDARIRQLRDEMTKVAETYGLGPDDVRVVFWFDS